MHAFLKVFFSKSSDQEDKAIRSFRLLSLTAVVAMWAIFAIWSWDHRREVEAAGVLSLEQQRLAVELEFRGDLKPAQVFLLLANRWVSDHPERDPRQDAAFLEMVRQFQGASKGIQVAVVDKLGEAYFLPTQGGHVSVGQEEYFLGALSQGPGRLYLGRPFLEKSSQQWKLPMAFALTTKNGPLAVLVAYMELGPILVELSERAAVFDSDILLFRRDGVLLAESATDGLRLGQPLSSERIFQQGIHAGTQQAVLRGQTLPQGEGWTAYGSTTEFPVVAVVSRSTRLIFAQWTHQFWFVLVLLVAASAVILIAARKALLALAELESSRESLRLMAITDSLTGLFNRRHFYDMAEGEWERAQRYNRPLSLIILDIDLFKLVNDTHGHAVGDEVLKNVANGCRAMLRDHDIMCRLGGEEFSIMLPETPLDGALQLAERLRLAIGAMVTRVGDCHVSVTISAGVAQTDGDDDGFGTLERRADNALYQAKEGGRNKICRG